MTSIHFCFKITFLFSEKYSIDMHSFQDRRAWMKFICTIYNPFKNKLIYNLCLIYIYDYKWFPHRTELRTDCTREKISSDGIQLWRNPWEGMTANDQKAIYLDLSPHFFLWSQICEIFLCDVSNLLWSSTDGIFSC